MLDTKRKVSHPGIYIKDAIEELGLSQTEFAVRSGLSIKNVSTLISGESRITVDVALKLASFFNTGVDGWINLQTKYDIYLIEEKTSNALKREWEIVKQFDNKFLNDYLNINVDSKNKDETIRELRQCFNVGTLEALKKPDMYAFCKTSINKDLTEKNIIMRNAWISLAEKMAANMKCNEFNKQVIQDNLLELRKLTLEHPETFHPKLNAIMKEAGIKLVILPYLANSLVGGVTKWIQNENCIMIAINDCGKSADRIWFSIFHEIGHAMKNHKRHLTISYEKDKIMDEDEVAANKFAKELLINEDDYREFVSREKFDLLSIQRFAKEQQVADFIVIGRLKNDNFIPWSMHNDRMIKYSVIY